MGARLELHSELKKFHPNVYFQPPPTVVMKYPCIVYNKVASQSYGGNSSTRYGNNKLYNKIQEYQITLIERDPDSAVAGSIESEFEYCSITQYFTVDNLHHTTLTLYY